MPFRCQPSGLGPVEIVEGVVAVEGGDAPSEQVEVVLVLLDAGENAP